MMAQLIYPLTFFLFFLASNRSQPVEFCVLFFSLEEQVVKYAPRMSVAANIGRFSLAQIRNGPVLPVKHSSPFSFFSWREGVFHFCGFEFNSFTSTGVGSFKCRSAKPVKIGKCFTVESDDPQAAVH